jgi:membrane associated rhomboid family serine protease
MNLFGNVGSDSTTGNRASLTTRFNVWLHAIPLFTRSIFIVCTFIWLIRALFNWPNTYAVCFHYDSIKGGEIYRLITFIFFHQDILHIIFNMMGLLSLCVFLEHKLGTIYMLCCTILLAILISAVDMFFNLVLIDILKLNDVKNSFFSIDSECGIGYSGVLFAYMILSVHHSPVTRSLFGVYSVSAKVYPWALLLLSSLLMPGVSFLGHLSGIVAGYIFILMLYKNSAFTKVVSFIERITPSALTQRSSYFPSDTSSENYTPLPYDGQQSGSDQRGAVPQYIFSVSSWLKSKVESVRGTSSVAEQPTDPWSNKGQGRALGHN